MLRRFCRPLRQAFSWETPGSSLAVPKTLAALEHLYGPTGEERGDVSTFVTFFAMSWRDGDRPRHHLQSIGDRKGALNVDYWRVEDEPLSGAEAGGFGEPSPDFPAAAMDAATTQLVEMLERHAGALVGTLQPFCRIVRSCLLAYGFRGGRFFEEAFEEQGELDAFVSAFDPDGALSRAGRDAVLSHYPPP
ncbi:MAG: hypothetical protein R3F59_02275 [Myxococcota bacterium]